MRFAIQISIIGLLLANLSLGQNVANEVSAMHQKLFDRYKIPKELQREEIGQFLHHMDWHLETIRKNEWRAATQHPARFGDYGDWSDVRLTF